MVMREMNAIKLGLILRVTSEKHYDPEYTG